MKGPFKIIHDTVHGSMKLSGVSLELMETPEVQRLHNIHQLGLAYLVFPGANHTRIEHSIGTGHVAFRMAREIGLDEQERSLVQTAGMLHDLGHGPFSHTLEFMLNQKTGLDHMGITKGVITGGVTMFGEAAAELGGDRIPEILEKHGLDPEAVADLVEGLPSRGTTLEVFESARSAQTTFSKTRYLHQIIHSTVDADQVDYLLRDSHYTGVAHGIIDLHRLLHTMAIHDGMLVVDRSGMSAVEGMLVARALMYTSVYFHKTVRIAELMLSRAVEAMDPIPDGIQGMVDFEIIRHLEEVGGLQRFIAQGLRYRKLFKQSYVLATDKLAEEQLRAIKELNDPEKRRAKENEICARIGAPEGHVIIDAPGAEISVVEPRMHMTDVMILDGDRPRPLDNFTPLARALAMRCVPDWVVMVATEASFREAAAKAAPKIIFG